MRRWNGAIKDGELVWVDADGQEWFQLQLFHNLPRFSSPETATFHDYREVTPEAKEADASPAGEDA